MGKTKSVQNPLPKSTQFEFYIVNEGKRWTCEAECGTEVLRLFIVTTFAESPSRALSLALDAVWRVEQGLEGNQLILPDQGDWQVRYLYHGS